MTLLTNAERPELIELLLRLLGVATDGHTRHLLAAPLPASIIQRWPQNGVPSTEVAILVDLADNEDYWPINGPPHIVALLRSAADTAPPNTRLRQQLEALRDGIEARLDERLGSRLGDSNASVSCEFSTTLLRAVLVKCFSSDELETFCFDYYHAIYVDSQGMRHSQRAQLLLERCQRDGQLVALEQRLRHERGPCMERALHERR